MCPLKAKGPIIDNVDLDAPYISETSSSSEDLEVLLQQEANLEEGDEDDFVINPWTSQTDVDEDWQPSPDDVDLDNCNKPNFQ